MGVNVSSPKTFCGSFTHTAPTTEPSQNKVAAVWVWFDLVEKNTVDHTACKPCIAIIFLPSGTLGLPLAQRSLPPSFWDPSPSLQSSQQVGASRPTTGLMQQNDELSTTLYSNQCYAFGHHGNSEEKGANFIRSRAVPVSFSELPAGAVKSVAPVSVAPFHSLPLPRDSAVQHSAPQTPVGFNPCYNAFLVQPEVRPQLPRIPGEPQKPERKGKDPGSGDGIAETILTDGNQ